MIVKPFTPSSFTLGLEALLARIHPAHPQFPKLEQELKRQQAGDYGEKYIMNELQTLSMDVQLLHNVILPTVLAIQIDILIITPNGIILLEVKNIKGTVLLKNNPRQLIRTTETGEVTIFTHPEIQLEQYMQGMKHFLLQHNITIPIYGAIVFPFNNVQIQRDGEGLPILMAKDLPMFIHTLPHRTEPISRQNITSKIMKNIKIKTPYPLCRYYKIDINSIQPGIRCEKCRQYSMVRQKRTWQCSNCQHTCVRAHKQALREYYMLIGNTITNQQCRQFLKIDNTDLAKRILQATCTMRSGSTKNRIYKLPHFP